MADDDIIVDLGGGRTASFPKGMSPQRIEFELKRAGVGQPHDVAGTYRRGGTELVDYVGTQATKAGTGLAGLPGTLQQVGGDVREWLGLKRDPGPAGAPAMPPKAGQVTSGNGAMTPPKIPSTEDMNRYVFGTLGVPEVDAAQILPPSIRGFGPYVDAMVQGGLGGGLLGGVRALVPGVVAGAGAQVAGDLPGIRDTSLEPWARVGGGLAGGGAGALAQRGVQYAGQVGRSLKEPWTEAGRDKIVGRALNATATDPKSAVAAMDNWQPGVPGSKPTAAQVANDPGLLALENVQKGQAGQAGWLGIQQADNNAARLAAVDQTFPNIPTAQQAGDTLRGAMQTRKGGLELLRDAAAGPMYKAARIADPSIPGRPILDVVNNAVMTETGPIRSALQEARKSLYIGEGKNSRLASTVEEWQAVKRALDAQVSAAGNNPTLERALVRIRNEVDGALKSGPLFKMADTTYRQLSEPLRPYTKDYSQTTAKALETGPYQGPYTRASELVVDDYLKRGSTGIDEALAAAGKNNRSVKQALAGRQIDDFKSAILTTADDPNGAKILSAAGATRWWQENRELAQKTMTPAQIKAMDTIVEDFGIGARRPQATAGSNTAANLGTQNMLQAILRFPTLANSSAARTMMWPLQKIYTWPEAQLQERLIDALRDPKVAQALMARASPGNVRLLAPMLEEALLGGAVGTSPALQNQ